MQMSEILNRRNAHKILNDDGSLKLAGPHVVAKPFYYSMNRNNQPVKRYPLSPIMAGVPMAGAVAPLIVTPALPGDAGVPVNISGMPFWTTNRPRAGGRQGFRSDCYRIACTMAIGQHAEWFLPFMLHQSPTGKVVAVFRPLARAGLGLVLVQMDGVVGSVGVDFSDVSDVCVGDFYLQRAYAYVRSLSVNSPSLNTYGSLDWGYAGSVFNDLGMGCMAVPPQYQDVMTVVMASIAAGKPIVVHTNGVTDGSLIPSHVYVMVSGDGADSFVLHNPWTGNADTDNRQTTTRQQLSANGASIVAVTTFPVTKPTMMGDVNRDGVVDIGDMVTIANAWGQKTGGADANADQIVDMADQVAVANAWGLRVDDVKGVFVAPVP